MAPDTTQHTLHDASDFLTAFSTLLIWFTPCLSFLYWMAREQDKYEQGKLNKEQVANLKNLQKVELTVSHVIPFGLTLVSYKSWLKFFGCCWGIYDVYGEHVNPLHRNWLYLAVVFFACAKGTSVLSRIQRVWQEDLLHLQQDLEKGDADLRKAVNPHWSDVFLYEWIKGVLFVVSLGKRNNIPCTDLQIENLIVPFLKGVMYNLGRRLVVVLLLIFNPYTHYFISIVFPSLIVDHFISVFLLPHWIEPFLLEHDIISSGSNSVGQSVLVLVDWVCYVLQVVKLAQFCIFILFRVFSPIWFAIAGFWIVSVGEKFYYDTFKGTTKDAFFFLMDHVRGP